MECDKHAGPEPELPLMMMKRCKIALNSNDVKMLGKDIRLIM